MINNIIILFTMVIAVIMYKKGKINWLLITIGVAYICMPVVRYGVNSGINSAYVITLVCFLIFLDSFFKRKLYFGKKQLSYLISMVIGVIFVFVGWLVNGKIILSGLIHFAGMLQYILGVFIFSIFIKSYSIDKKSLYKKIFTIVILLNYCMGIIQLFNWELGEKVTRQLYTYAGKSAPLDSTGVELGKFVRIFGTFYSPTVLGVVSLLISAFFLHEVIKQRKILSFDAAMYMVSVGLGLLAFSKITIIGSFLLLIINILLAVIQKSLKGKVSIYFRALALLVSVFVCIGSLQCALGLGNYVRYYYFKVSNIIVAMETRYGNLLSNSNEKNANESLKIEEAENNVGNKEKTEGNMNSAFDVFRKHPIIGVGPMSVEGEFLGDSEYISILHNGGILSFLTYAYCYGSMALYYFIKKCNHELIMLMGIGMGAVSMMVFSYGCIIPLVAYCICDYEKNSTLSNDRC